MNFLNFTIFDKLKKFQNIIDYITVWDQRTKQV